MPAFLLHVAVGAACDISDRAGLRGVPGSVGQGASLGTDLTMLQLLVAAERSYLPSAQGQDRHCRNSNQ